MPDFQPMTREELDAVQFSSNPDDHRWLATVRDREDRLRRAVEKCKTVDSPCESPPVLLLDNFHTGLMCGVEDRGHQTNGYEGAEYGFHEGVDRALEWARSELQGILAENADLLKGDSPCGSSSGS